MNSISKTSENSFVRIAEEIWELAESETKFVTMFSVMVDL